MAIQPGQIQPVQYNFPLQRRADFGMPRLALGVDLLVRLDLLDAAWLAQIPAYDRPTVEVTE